MWPGQTTGLIRGHQGALKYLNISIPPCRLPYMGILYIGMPLNGASSIQRVHYIGTPVYGIPTPSGILAARDSNGSCNTHTASNISRSMAIYNVRPPDLKPTAQIDSKS